MEDYAELALPLLGERLQAGDGKSRAEQFIRELEHLASRCGLPTTLRDAGVTRQSLPQLASDAMQQQRLLVNNPRSLSEADALAIYEVAY
jgi:alcohol dehydrogenase class IV